MVGPISNAHERRDLVAALASAFIDDPGWRSTVQSPMARRSVLHISLSALLSVPHDRQVVLVARRGVDVVGGAVAWGPGHHPSPLGSVRYVLAGAAILVRIGVATLRVWRRRQIMRSVEPSEPHWHLAAIGVRPDAQRCGAGHALLASFVEMVDAAQAPAYLETSRAELLAWYRSAGFGVRQQLTQPGGATGWTLWRTPSVSGRVRRERSD